MYDEKDVCKGIGFGLPSFRAVCLHQQAEALQKSNLCSCGFFLSTPIPRFSPGQTGVGASPHQPRRSMLGHPSVAIAVAQMRRLRRWSNGGSGKGRANAGELG